MKKNRKTEKITMRDLARALSNTKLEIIDVGPRTSEVHNKNGECVFTGSYRAAYSYVIDADKSQEAPD